MNSLGMNVFGDLRGFVTNVRCFMSCVLLSGRKSLPQWFDGMLKSRGGAFLTSGFEGGGLLSQPTLRDRKGPFSVRATLQWMDLLLASLDCYTTFISLHILKPPHMISELGCCRYTYLIQAGRPIHHS